MNHHGKHQISAIGTQTTCKKDVNILFHLSPWGKDQDKFWVSCRYVAQVSDGDGGSPVCFGLEAALAGARAVVVGWCRPPATSRFHLEVVSESTPSGSAASELCAHASRAWLRVDAFA